MFIFLYFIVSLTVIGSSVSEWRYVAFTNRADFFISVDSKYNFQQAKSFCHLHKGTLAQFKTHDEFSSVVKEIPRAWMQGTLKVGNGHVFLYDDGARVGEFANWRTNQPDNYGGIESRVELSKIGLNDHVPSTRLHALCERHGINNWKLLLSHHDAEFFISNGIMTYKEADLYCHRSGGKLAQFKSTDEFTNVAKINKQTLWMQGRRPCRDSRKFICGTGDMAATYVYDDGTKVGVFARWGNRQPNYGSKSNVILRQNVLHDYVSTSKFSALCKREWRPLVTVDRVEFFRSVSPSLEYNGAKMFCLRNGGKLAQFKLDNEFSNVINAKGRATYWIDATKGAFDFVYSDGKKVGEYAQWGRGEPNNYRGLEDRVVLYAPTGTLHDVVSTRKVAALCERVNLNAWRPIANIGNALFFTSVASQLSFNEGYKICTQLGGDVVQFKSTKEAEILAAKLPEGRFWIAGSGKGNSLIYPNGKKVGSYAKLRSGEGQWDWKLDRPGSMEGQKVLCRRSTMSISDQELKSVETLVRKKLNCAARSKNNQAKKAFCESLQELLTKNTLEDQVNFFLLTKLGFSKFRVIKELSAECVSRRLVMKEMGNTTSGSSFRRRVPVGTNRYDVGELQGNAREACRDWVSKVDAQNGDNLCGDIAKANKKSVEALELTEYSNTVLGGIKAGAAVVKVGLAAGYVAASVTSGAFLDGGDAVGYALDAAAMVVDAVETAGEAAYQFQSAAVNRLEIEAQKLNGRAAEYDECSRPSTTELNCGIGQLSVKLDKYLPLMNDKLDSLILSNVIIEEVVIDIKNDMRSVLSELSEIKSLSEKIVKYVKHDSNVHEAIQSLDEVYQSSLEADSRDFEYWFPSYVKQSCTFLRELEEFALRILNYLGRPIDDKRGSLLESSRPLTGLQRPKKTKFLTPFEVEFWLQEYTSEYKYLVTLAKFGYALNGLVHINGYKKMKRDLEEYFNRLHPYADYRHANSKYLESLNFIDSFPKLQKCLPCGIRGENIYSWCTKDEMSRTFCTNCHIHYHERNNDCIQNTCKCNNGKAKKYCARNDDSSCESCNAGYTAEGTSCRKARCVCKYGVPVSSTHCPRENTNKCQTCTKNYHVKNYQCVWKPRCTCRDGTPRSGRGCYGGENCNHCRYGYERLGPLCTRRYTYPVLRSGDAIGLKVECGKKHWISNYCTVNCNKHTEMRSCPGDRFSRSEGSSCSGERIYIVAEGKARGEAINFGDIVGLYYGAGHWMSCYGIHRQCRTRSCPGSWSRYLKRGWKWKNNRCSWEKFQIQSSLRLRYRGVVKDWDSVSIRSLSTHNGWISADHHRVTLRTCPRQDGNGWLTHNCGCERFRPDRIYD